MPFQPGKSGNPAGRVKRDFLTQHIIAELNEVTADQVTKARKLVVALIDKGMDGDVPALREIFDRVEGKVAQVLAGDPDAPLVPGLRDISAEPLSAEEWQRQYGGAGPIGRVNGNGTGR